MSKHFSKSGEEPVVPGCATGQYQSGSPDLSRSGAAARWRYASKRGVWIGLIPLIMAGLLLPTLDFKVDNDVTDFMLLGIGRVIDLLKPVYKAIMPMPLDVWLLTDLLQLVGLVVGLVIMYVMIMIYLLEEVGWFPNFIVLLETTPFLVFLLWKWDVFLHSRFGAGRWRVGYHGGVWIMVAVMMVGVARLVPESGLGVATTLSRWLLDPVRWREVNAIRGGEVDLYATSCYSVAPVSGFLASGGRVEIAPVADRIIEFNFPQSATRSGHCYYLEIVGNPELATLIVKNYKYDGRSHGAGYKHSTAHKPFCFASLKLQQQLPQLLRSGVWLKRNPAGECRFPLELSDSE